MESGKKPLQETYLRGICLGVKAHKSAETEHEIAYNKRCINSVQPVLRTFVQNRAFEICARN